MFLAFWKVLILSSVAVADLHSSCMSCNATKTAIQEDEWASVAISSGLESLNVRMRTEMQRKGLQDESFSKMSELEKLLRFAKLSCYFDKAEDAQRGFEHVLQVEQDNFVARLGLGKVLLARGFTQKAEEVLKVLVTSKTNAQAEFYGRLMHRVASRRLGIQQRGDEDAFWDYCCHILKSAHEEMQPSSTFQESWCKDLRSLESKEATANSKTSMQKRKFAKLSGILPESILVEFLQPWFAYVSQHEGAKLLTRNGLLPVSVRENNMYARKEVLGDPIVEMVNVALIPFVERIMDMVGKLSPTYSFPIEYLQNGHIDPHIDQKDNEISLSFQLQLEGALRWPLHFIDPDIDVIPGRESPAEISITRKMLEDAPSIEMRNNDGILYRGRELVHFRKQNPSSEVNLRQLIFAWRKSHPLHCIGE